MPPHARNKNRIARLQLGALPGSDCFTKTGKLVEVRIAQFDQTDGLTAGRRLKWAWVEIENLLRRKQREAAFAYRTTRDVVGSVVVAGGNGPITDPDRRWR